MSVPPKKWRSERQIRGIQSQVQGAINADKTGAEVTIDIAVAHALIEICEQARHTEKEHEPPE